jgi:uncharacterized membrane protein
MTTLAITRTESTAWLNESLFWLHVAVIVAGLFMGLVLPLQLVVAIVALHRLHLFVFDGCILSKYQTTKSGLASSENFLQHMTRRLIGKNIEARTAKMLDYGIALSSIAIAYIATLPQAIQALEFIIASFFMIWGMHACYRIYVQQKAPPVGVCSVDGSCDQVKNSSFSRFLGVPIELIGLGYFTLLIVLESSMHVLQLHNYWLAPITAIILIATTISLLFIYLQSAVIKKLCQKCMNVHGASIFLAGFSLFRLLV